MRKILLLTLLGLPAFVLGQPDAESGQGRRVDTLDVISGGVSIPLSDSEGNNGGEGNTNAPPQNTSHLFTRYGGADAERPIPPGLATKLYFEMLLRSFADEENISIWKSGFQLTDDQFVAAKATFEEYVKEYEALERSRLAMSCEIFAQRSSNSDIEAMDRAYGNLMKEPENAVQLRNQALNQLDEPIKGFISRVLETPGRNMVLFRADIPAMNLAQGQTDEDFFNAACE